MNGAILVVYPYCLDHVGHGNIQRVFGIARYLRSQGVTVDLVYQASATVAQVDQYHDFRQVFAVRSERRAAGDTPWSRWLERFYAGFEPPPTHLRPSAALSMLVRSLIEGGDYRAAVATYAWTAPIFRDLAKPIVTVCDVQDILHEHAAACLASTGQSTTFALPRETEAYLWRQWDMLLAITPKDQEQIRRFALPDQPVMSARHSSTLLAQSPSHGQDDRALYAASDNLSNVQAVTWLIEEVWPQVLRQRPAARLRIAGLICRALPAHLDMTGIEVIGFREDLSDEVAAAGVIVAPYHYGSGLKIKVVEAVCAGKATVTTSAGLIGSGLTAGSAIEVQDDAGRFANAMAALMADAGARRRLGVEALQEAHALYSIDVCYGPLIDAIRLRTVAPVVDDATTVSQLQRIVAVTRRGNPQRLVLWGNGANTRSLAPSLLESGVAVSAIVDGGASTPSRDPAGTPIIPKDDYAGAAGDLVVLSSQVYEDDMWVDTAVHRDAGAMVLSLVRPQRVSTAIVEGRQ